MFKPGQIKAVESIPVDPIVIERTREAFEVDIRALVSILNTDNLDRETITLVNEKIRQCVNDYHNPVYIIKEM